ncbi:hypothetical protein AQUCO_04700048v1 [Aquilegia coerulea]|uniref:Pyruvate, phosphate dikinase regulatory protein, chloroplastic n=1 Tax=Aquilegia coerulea TaxID=218851 RepID=A0A2G5CKV6_AQUCA|nr:hypothetical protein AQUCO_04700048v1 [Aquilegia coerulea]PIA31913.1 hypothetical protein AQUCO_04700048v1 [Aquilegia coerulea]
MMMISIPTLTISSISDSKYKSLLITNSSSSSSSTHNQNIIPESSSSSSNSEQHPQLRSNNKLKGSSKLNRWSRARTVRSGRRLDRRPVQLTTQSTTTDVISPFHHNLGSVQFDSEYDDVTSDITPASAASGGGAKEIYMVSDGTGWTAEHSVNAALGQFEHCLVDRNCSVNTHLFSGIDDEVRLVEIIKQAAKEGAMLIYTLADHSMAESAKQACTLWGVPSSDILSPITEAIAAHIGVSPSGLPRGAPGRKLPLGEEYFRRIEAIEFTIKQDDGAYHKNLHNCLTLYLLECLALERHHYQFIWHRKDTK